LKAFYDLVEVMRRLREKDGCPWDREQNHETLKPYLVEETYEVLEAIDKKDDIHLMEELGDLLLQIVFHAQIEAEEGRFTIDDVAAEIVKKLKRRHPHVFGTVKVDTPDQVLENWEHIKKSEGKESVLDGVPKELPALLKARRVQEKVKRVGFDWEDIDGAMRKVTEEVKELGDALAHGDEKHAKEEFGDVLFSLVNVSRFLGIDAEDALRKTIDKVMERFRYLEQKVREKPGKPLEQYTLEELDRLWESAKDE
jgi:tetrapyrrole methylase family protein/MazG family protein